MIDEILLVCLPDIGKHAYGRTNHILQRHHLVRFRDTRFEDGQLVALVHLPHRKRHAHLRVVTLGTAHDVVVGAKHLVEPFLDNGLAIATCNANDRDTELLTMVGCQRLQSFQRVGHNDERGFRTKSLGALFHHKSPDTFLVKLLNVLMTVVTMALQGKKQGLIGIHQMAAVDEQIADFAFI